MIEFPTDFCYLGDRHYLHGTTALIAGLALLESNTEAPLLLKRLKFLKEASGNGRILLSQDPALKARFKESAWHLTCQASETTWRAVFQDEGRPVNCRESVEYAISDLQPDGACGGRCVISPRNRDDLVRLVVEANKRFHLASLPETTPNPQVRFGYLENWQIPSADIAFTGELTVSRLAAHQSGASLSTINRLQYRTGNDHTESMVMCFEVSTEQRPTA